MKFYEKIQGSWNKNNSMVCVGLDPDLTKLPECVKHLKYPIFEFNKAIIDHTADSICAYKPQIAYYAGQQAEDQLQMTIDYLKQNFPDIPVILDSKRGDIGSTAAMYAKEAFERYKADAVTVNPFMGTDALKPFLDYKDKGVVVLCRTSNPSSSELQELCIDDKPLYEFIAEYAREKWNYNQNVALVIGATFPEELGTIRRICPEIPFLVPGIGAQGGDVKKVLENGLNSDGNGLIINSSRGIIYAGHDEDYAIAAGNAVNELNSIIRENISSG